MNKLKPCPFCGGPAEYHATSEGHDHSSGYVRCKAFCCEQGHVMPKDEAIEEWNRRYEPHQELDFDYGAED